MFVNIVNIHIVNFKVITVIHREIILKKENVDMIHLRHN